MLAASGTGLLLAGNQSVSVSYDSGFTEHRPGRPPRLSDPGAGSRSRPTSLGWLAAQLHRLRPPRAGDRRRRGRGAADGAAGRSREVPRLRAQRPLAGLAGVILAAQFGAGQPTEGVGWELFAIASVVVGGTLLTGGVGSVGATLAGVLLLGLVFNILNFENGLGWISLSRLLAVGHPRRLPAAGRHPAEPPDGRPSSCRLRVPCAHK